MTHSRLITSLAFCLALPAVAFSVSAAPQYNAVYGDSLLILDQGWDAEERDRFYHEPQGSPIMPYEWFLILEQAESEKLFRANDHMQSFGLITAAGPSARNPDALPIGLTKDLGLYKNEAKLGMNCGACHTSEVSYQGKQVLINGGAAHFDFWSFMTALDAALLETWEDDAKFKRFAGKLLQGDPDEDTAGQLRARLRGVVRDREDWAFRNATHIAPGPGRVDALNVILNQVTAMMLNRPDNARPSDAPVSYPFVWDAPYLDYVQYNAVVPNAGPGAIGRNVGQVLGVFGEVSMVPSSLPPGYASSVRTDHLLILERALETLVSPTWEEMAKKGVLPSLDQAKVAEGEKIYDRTCGSCHEVIDRQDRGELASIEVKTMSLADIGTDPVASLNFTDREVETGPLFGRKTDFLGGEPLCERTHADQLLAHVTVGAMIHDLSATGGPILGTLGSGLLTGAADAIKNLFEHSLHGSHKQKSDQAVIDRLAAAGSSEAEIAAELARRSGDRTALYTQLVQDGLDRHGENRHCMEVLEHAVYRARPLNGVWATGPFLHNGSVPSIADMLLAPEQRPVTFYVGSRELDPLRVGFENVAGPRTMEFDTRIPGNSNSGHVYGTRLSAADKAALLEYVKVL
ncbi:MAG: di-heme-cytochrome C peroxidase [Haliea sp.]|nr:di-heme-cytochrome C peroxidase [Haliea sp.]